MRLRNGSVALAISCFTNLPILESKFRCSSAVIIAAPQVSQAALHIAEWCRSVVCGCVGAG